MKLLAAFAGLALLLAACSDGGSDPPQQSPTATAVPASTATIEPSAVPSQTPAPTLSPTQSPAIEPTATVAPASTPTATGQSGVQGVALVGPSCPVQQAPTPCPDRPWEGVVVARDIAGGEIARTATDSEGRFSLPLPPGDYVLVTLTVGFLPAPAELTVTVVDGQVTFAELLLDSGIR